MSSADSRARVLDAALRLIRKRGDAAVTMAQIAKAARLSRQAVYLHFADRADLMVALARHVNESLGLPAEIQRMMNSPTGIEMIEAFVSMQARGNPAVWAVARTIDAVRRTDAAADVGRPGPRTGMVARAVSGMRHERLDPRPNVLAIRITCSANRDRLAIPAAP